MGLHELRVELPQGRAMMQEEGGGACNHIPGVPRGRTSNPERTMMNIELCEKGEQKEKQGGLHEVG